MLGDDAGPTAVRLVTVRTVLFVSFRPAPLMLRTCESSYRLCCSSRWA